MVTDQGLVLVPLTFRQAAAFVRSWHRHLDAPRGMKFALGCALDRKLVGVAMVGRPVSRVLDDGRTLEVNRTATDGTENVNSFLYGAARRATFALGYDRLITYTQEGESGASLRAAGYKIVGERPARGGWDAPSRPRESRGADDTARTLWEA